MAAPGKGVRVVHYGGHVFPVPKTRYAPHSLGHQAVDAERGAEKIVAFGAEPVGGGSGSDGHHLFPFREGNDDAVGRARREGTEYGGNAPRDEPVVGCPVSVQRAQVVLDEQPDFPAGRRRRRVDLLYGQFETVSHSPSGRRERAGKWSHRPDRDLFTRRVSAGRNAQSQNRGGGDRDREIRHFPENHPTPPLISLTGNRASPTGIYPTGKTEKSETRPLNPRRKA